MMRAAALAVALALSPATFAQVGAPESWRAQRFAFPLAFAPSIPYEGTEHVRFAPYWTDFEGDRGFTYVVLWDIKRRELQPQELERGLNVYFDGLMEAATKARKIADPGTVSGAALHPMATPEGWKDALGGRVWTWNGFGKGEPLVLHAEVTTRDCGADRTHVFYAFSKASRSEAAAWDELRAIRKATAC